MDTWRIAIADAGPTHLRVREHDVLADTACVTTYARGRSVGAEASASSTRQALLTISANARTKGKVMTRQAAAPVPDPGLPVRDQLERILASTTFQQSDRLKRFLTFIVQRDAHRTSRRAEGICDRRSGVREGRVLRSTHATPPSASRPAGFARSSYTTIARKDAPTN